MTPPSGWRCAVRRPLVFVLLLFPGGCRDDAAAAWTPVDAVVPWPVTAGDPIPVPAALAGLDWLGDPSTWGWTGVGATRSDRGTLGVGNGVVFTIVGLDGPTTLTNTLGPGYQADAGFFPDLTLVLLQGGAGLPVTDARVQRPRGSAVARSLVVSGDLSLSTTVVAPPDLAELVQHVTVRNDGATSASGLTLGGLPGETTRGARTMRAACDATEVPALDPGTEWSTTCRYMYSADGTWPDPVDAVAALSASYAATQAFLTRAMRLETPDPKVADLYEGMLVTERVQTSTIGVVSPMNRYTGGWLRDTEGPARLYLRAGLTDEVGTMLEATFAAMVAREGISNSFALDYDPAPLPEDPTAFWAAASFMEGRNPAEAPSFPVLLHGEWAAFTGDTWDEQRQAFLEACVDRQVPGAEGLLPFSGDETYRYPLATALGEGMPEEVGWSAGSAILYDAARTVVSGADVGMREAFWTGEWYAPIARYGDLSWTPAPFEDVSLLATWWRLDDPHAADNAEGVLDVLLHDDGTLLSTLPGTTTDSPMVTGMIPGYLLEAAATLHRPEEALAFGALALMASPSGHFEELHGPDHRPLTISHQADGLGGDVPARYRPWEGGDVVAAMLDYLLGQAPSADTLSLAPHLPPGWPSVGASDLRWRGEPYDLKLEGYAEGEVLTLTRTGASPWPVRVILHGARPITAVTVDGVAVEAEPGGSDDVVSIGVTWEGSSLQLTAVYAP